MKTFVPVVIVTGILLHGCGGDQRGELAQKRLQDRKKPGYVRIVNLSSGPLDLWYKNGRVAATCAIMEATELLPLGTGEQTLRVEYKTDPKSVEFKKLEVKANFVTNVGVSIIVMPDLTTKLIEGEIRYGTDESNVHVVPIEAGGTLPSSVNLTGVESKSLPVKDSLVLFKQGKTICPDGSTIEIKERIAYSLFIVATPSKVYYILGKNASDKQPIATGTSAA